MKIKMISISESPIETLLAAWYHSRPSQHAIFDDSNEIDLEKVKEDLSKGGESLETLKLLLRSRGMPLLRHISMTFSMTDIPVFLREQLVRHQQGNHFWVRSSRIDDLSAMEGYIPPFMNEESKRALSAAYKNIRETYSLLLDLGISKEDAKMIMPEGRLHHMTWSTNLQALQHVLEKRAEWFAQDIWTEVILMISQELRDYLTERYNKEIAELVVSSFGDPSCSPDPEVDDYRFKVDSIEKLKGLHDMPVDPIFLYKYTPGHEVKSYPKTCEEYKIKEYFNRFKKIWSEKYRGIIEKYEKVMSNDMTETEINEIIENVEKTIK